MRNKTMKPFTDEFGTTYEKTKELCAVHRITRILVRDPIGCDLYNCYEFCPECNPDYYVPEEIK